MNESSLQQLARRRSVLARNLQAPGPSDDELSAMLEIALRVPDHGKVEPFRVVVLDEGVKASLGRLIGEIYTLEYPEAPPEEIAKEACKHTLGPVMMAVICEPNPQKFAKVPLIEQQLSCGSVCLNLLHAATAYGYGAQWLTAWPAYNPRVNEALGAKNEAHIVGFIHIGTAIEQPKERPRPDPARVVHFATGALNG